MDVGEVLVELQDRDLKIMRLEKQLDELPEKRAILTGRAKLAEIRKLLERTEAVRRAQEGEVSRLDDEGAALATKMEAEQAKMSSGEVTNPRELQAIALEMDSLRRHKSDLDNRELERMTKMEAAAEQSRKVQAALEAGDAREAALVAEFKDKGSHLLQEIETLKGERQKLAGKLPADVSARYETLRSSKHGIAVGELNGEACGVCRVTIPQGKLDAIRQGEGIGDCPNCSRMVVVKDRS